MANPTPTVVLHTRPAKIERVIRDPAFAARLESACDSHSECPPLHQGRQTWVRDQLKMRFDTTASSEAVRRWFWGEVKPRPDKIAMLAEILLVDVVWLQLGIDQGLSPRDRKARNALADGVVNVVAGFIQMDGGHPAFPAEGDVHAEKDNVDIHAIIRGGNYALHIALGTEAGEGLLIFPVPAKHNKVIVLGVIRAGLAIEIFEIPPDLIADHGIRRGASIEVTVNRAELRRIESFSQRF